MSDEILDNEVLPTNEEVVEVPAVEPEPVVVEEVQAEVVVEEPVVEKVEETDVIVSESPKPKKPSVEMTNGAISSTSANKKEKAAPKAAEKQDDKVALFSTKNVHWGPVGRVYRGYNIVSADKADLWLQRSHIRLATPEEVARELNL